MEPRPEPVGILRGRGWGSGSDRWAPVLLIAMAITFPELLTGSTQFLSLLNPLALLGLVGLYGAGALAIREFRVRCHAGWPSVVLLGAAYGVLEEGFATRTFFAPASLLGVQGAFGHFASINWVWAVQLATFHAVFSIALPIFLLDVAYPALRGRPLVSTRGAWVTLGVLLATAAVLAVLLNPSVRPSVPPLLAVAGLGAGLLFAGIQLRGYRPSFPVPPAAANRRLAMIGATWVTSFFAINWLGPVLIPVPWVLVTVELLSGGALLWAAVRAYGPVWDPKATVALAAGLLSFLLVFATVLELFGDWGVGVAVGGVAALLILLYRRPIAAAPVAVGPAATAKSSPVS
jgi:hypothetical protein